MAQKAFYLKLAIEGIQKYICSTGKLKEMIGGSEIINHIASPGFYDEILKGMGMAEDADLRPAPGRYVVAQANAGALCLIMPDRDSARRFLRQASEKLLADFPGLPFYGAVAEFDWTDDEAGRQAYQSARKDADDLIGEQRNAAPVAQGSCLLPVLRAARLDGLPAVGKDEEELISLPSLARRNQEMINKSRERLRRDVKAPPGVDLEWRDNLEDLLGREGGKVALICMDGNDLGKLFGRQLEEAGNRTLREFIAAMKSLSRRLEECNRKAFSHACAHVAEYEIFHGRMERGAVVMPLRPLVMGGDDITIIARADVALPFVEMFARKFDEIGKEDNFSIGIGMVVMDSSYPFAKAFPLAESLQDSAKKLTSSLEPGKRPSSLDYLVLTEEVENDAALVRQRLFTTANGEILTGKPFILGESFQRFLVQGDAVLSQLSRGQIRNAWSLCRQGPGATRQHWLNLKENLARKLGGRDGKRMKVAKFEEIFRDGYFAIHKETGKTFTYLGDYLELERLLPADARGRLLEAMKREGTDA